MRHTRVISLVLLALLLSSSSPIATAQGNQPGPGTPSTLGGPDLLTALGQATGGAARVAYHADTGKVRFIGTEPAHPITAAPGVAANADPEQVARGFLATYGPLFGLSDESLDLKLQSADLTDSGRSFVRFQQVHKGIPVLAGELVIQLDAARRVLSANGEVLPAPQTGVVPAIGADAARAEALRVVARGEGVGELTLTASQPELWLYNPVLLGAPGPRVTALVWRLEVRGTAADTNLRELVLIDAQRGFVALHFNQVPDAKSRRICDGASIPGAGVPCSSPVRTEGGPPSATVPDVNQAYDYLGDTYDFYLTYHGRDSLDGNGMALVATVRYCPSPSPLDCPYANAFWNGTQMVFGQGYAAGEDVVAHELTHAVTEKTSHLFYYMQSGAINESLSDVWGELVEQTYHPNLAGRWLMGESIPGGAIRSMSDPTSFGDPDRTGSPYYVGGYTDAALLDNGGVHANSGVNNKAAYLMTDGATFNGKTVTGLGIAKVAKIYYEAQTHLLTSGSDYQDLYDDLQQACTNLTASAVTTAADCQQVKNAVDAVEMNVSPTNAPATHAPVCAAGQTATDVWFDDLENPAAGKWEISKTLGPTGFYYPQNPNAYTSLGNDATYTTSGVYNIWGDDPEAAADYRIAMTQSVLIPAGAFLHFSHAFDFDSDINTRYDGGVVEYSADGGATWHDLGSLLADNGYTGTIAAGDASNPLAGHQAFTGISNGYVSSRASLSSLAGQSVRFRFRIGTDSSFGDLGWFVDDVRIYTCASTAGLTSVYLPSVVKTEAVLPSPVTIFSDGFEGAFPGPWQIYTAVGSSGYYWYQRNCRAFAGGSSIWGIGGNGAGLTPCGSTYPSSTNTLLVYGPFSLSGATAADLTFKLWLNTEQAGGSGVYDGVCRLASSAGPVSGYDGICTAGNTGGWVDKALDLKNVGANGSLLGKPQVWIALEFFSDSTVNLPEGGYVDIVAVRKCTAPGCQGMSLANGALGDGDRSVDLPASRPWSFGDGH